MEIIGYHESTPRRIKPPEPNLTLVNELFPDFGDVKINYQELGKKLKTPRKSKN
jgi:hypothetical protein